MRIPQVRGHKGSLKWIQVLINQHPHFINAYLGYDNIEWRSPLANDDFAEYRDDDFLSILGVGHLRTSLKDFWPRSGPQWDALGKAGEKIFLVEAKANIPEISSSCAAKSPKSVAKIDEALTATKAFIGTSGNDSWKNGYYQYANRLAHLYFLREHCSVDAELVFVYFCDDPTHTPTSIAEWKVALADQKQAMGLPDLRNVTAFFISCQMLQP